MTRIYITAEPDDTGEATDVKLSWFTRESATKYDGETYWDGNNNADVNTRESHRGQHLYRTAQGRWVIQHWTSWSGEQDSYHYATEDQARDWLIRNGWDAVVTEHFGEIEDERGPGRPEIGGRVTIRLGDLKPELDAWADAHGCNRAEAIRRILTDALHSVEHQPAGR